MANKEKVKDLKKDIKDTEAKIDKQKKKLKDLKKELKKAKKENYDFATLKLLGKLKDKKDLFIGLKDKKTQKPKKFPYSKLEHVQGNPFVVA